MEVPRPAPRPARSRDRLALTIDGGGMRGAVSIKVLIVLLRMVRLKSGNAAATLSDCFDMVIGTSTGGIIAALIVFLDMPLERVFELYSTLGSKVFGESAKVHNMVMSLVAHYSDKTMLEFLLEFFGTRRLDEEGTAFRGDDLKGAAGVRFAVTALDISTDPSNEALLRNYAPPTASPTYMGTNGAFIVEAVRGTTSAATFIHPYSRKRAPIHTSTSAITRVQSSYYEVTVSGRYYENIEVILDYAPTREEKIRLFRAVLKDEFMNLATLTDGGSFANNASEVAIVEGREAFGADLDNLIVINIGTGKLPVVPNRTWHANGLKSPADRGLILGEHTVKEVLFDLLNGAFVGPATDTEKIHRRVTNLYKHLASVYRLNPPLRKAFALDDFSRDSAAQMIEDTNAWIASPEGQTFIGEAADKIVAHSAKLRALSKAQPVK